MRLRRIAQPAGLLEERPRLAQPSLPERGDGAAIIDAEPATGFATSGSPPRLCGIRQSPCRTRVERCGGSPAVSRERREAAGCPQQG